MVSASVSRSHTYDTKNRYNILREIELLLRSPKIAIADDRDIMEIFR